MSTRSIQLRINEVWRRVDLRFLGEDNPLARLRTNRPIGVDSRWNEQAPRIRQHFEAHFGLSEVARRFQVPEDYAAFMQGPGGGWVAGNREWTIFHEEQVAAATAEDFRLCVVDACDEEPVLDSGFWLTIGRFGDKHFYLLCCDREHSHFGVVVDGHDSHPWSNGIEFAACTVMAKTFLDWLELHAYPAGSAASTDPDNSAERPPPE